MEENVWNIKKQIKNRIFPDIEEATEAILLSRGISNNKDREKFFNPDYDRDSHDPFLLIGMREAVSRTTLAVEKNQKICIFADYDADGITSSVILQSFLTNLGADVFTYIPDRNKEGYGINEKSLEYIAQKKTSLIITVDCGVSNAQEVEHAKNYSIDTIIIDHHHVPPKVPDAIAVIDPKQNNDTYPDKNLSGVGVTFKFLQALATKNENYDQQQLKWFLDLVAIGTIADCVPLIGENRMLSKFGLLVLSKKMRTGLRQLFHVGRISIDQNLLPSSELVAFQIAPRINAAGRMDHANIAQKLLLCDRTQESDARLLALEIEEKNIHRQKVTRQIVEQVNEKISASDKSQKIIIEKSENWELGVVGLAAGKITDQHQKPSILLKDFGSYYKGSGRSIPEFNMIEALESNSKYLEKYGGHSQAAGMEIKKENFKEFCKAMRKIVDKIEDSKFCKVYDIDYQLEISQISNKLYDELKQLEPFGNSNKKPAFVTKGLEVLEVRQVGNGEKHLKIICANDKNQLDVIGFGLASNFKDLSEGDKIDIAYKLDRNTWNGKSKLQALLLDLKIA